MLLINMRIFKTVLLIASFSAGCVRCLPVDGDLSGESRPGIPPSLDAPATAAIAGAPAPAPLDYYDQRQNGGENYRIHVDGLVLVLAPVEALFLAGTAGTTTTEANLSISQGGSAQESSGEQTPIDKPAAGLHNKTEPAISKMIQRPALRLASLLTPLLRRIHHERSANVR